MSCAHKTANFHSSFELSGPSVLFRLLSNKGNNVLLLRNKGELRMESVGGDDDDEDETARSIC